MAAPAGTVSVRVRFFALLRERAGCDERRVQVPTGSTVGDLLERLAGEIPDMPAGVAAAVDRAYASRDRALRGGEEVALIPPVSGG
ncbi:MAG TPA: molybdopterin converting factor subunit 1 [Gemmatimonadota bacterium]|nr:molybdopterin converting factor subunit 1 [Gemmatimonadota bacterium]